MFWRNFIWSNSKQKIFRISGTFIHFSIVNDLLHFESFIWNRKLKIINVSKKLKCSSLYDKRDDFNFHITNFPFLSSNIPSLPAYGVFVSQLIRYARACSSHECSILRAMRLSNKLLGQGYVKERL